MQKYRTDTRLFFPQTADNTYRGIPAAKYTFYMVAALTVLRSMLYLFLAGEGAQTGAVYMFGVWGVPQLLVGAFYWIVALRYKSLIPLAYAFVAAEYAARIAVGGMHPAALGAAPGIGNYILLPLAGGMLLLSITYRERRSPESRMRRQ